VYIQFGGDGFGGEPRPADGADVSILGPSPSAFFGDSLAAGDVNGDGTQDLIVGATFAQVIENGQAGPQPGAAYVFYGEPDWAPVIDVAESSFDVALYGAEHLDEIGDTVASGDLNGDGFDDVIATGEAADGPSNERPVAAEVVVMAGREDLAGEFRVGVDELMVEIVGAESNDTVGFDLAAGDLNGDGTDDVAMSARLADGPNNGLESAGETYILYGREGLDADLDLAQDMGDVAAYHSARGGDLMGRTLILEGDEPRLVLGVGFGDGPGGTRPNAGQVYILATSPAGSFEDVTAAAEAVYHGAAADDGFGTSVIAADLYGDGRPELIAVAADADPEADRVDFGAIYVLPLLP
jgi:hypothetical protein